MTLSKEEKDSRKPRVLMVGPGRDVRGGISTVVNTYYQVGLDEKVELRYIASMEDGSKFKKLRVAVRAYVEFCRTLRYYDIVHIHMAAQASFWRKAFFVRKAHKAGKRVIIHQHGGDFESFFYGRSGEWKKQMIRSVFEMTDKLVVLSGEWARFFRGDICDGSKIIILHNSVPMPSYRKSDYTDHKVLFLGRLGREKGSYDLLGIIPKVLECVHDVSFFFGGDGELEKSREIAKINGIEEHVRFLGWVNGEERERYLENASIFVLPSYHEGMPMAVLEAMSYGLATIATDVGGIPQVIRDGVNGILIGTGDLEALTDALVSLLQDVEKRKGLGQTAYRYIEKNFNAEKNIEILYRLYLGLY